MSLDERGQIDPIHILAFPMLVVGMVLGEYIYVSTNNEFLAVIPFFILPIIGIYLEEKFLVKEKNEVDKDE